MLLVTDAITNTTELVVVGSFVPSARGERPLMDRRILVMVYIERAYLKKKKTQLFALRYTFKKHSLIKMISTATCFGPIRPSSGSCRV